MAPLEPNNTSGYTPFESRLISYARTDVGMAREKNEDNLGQASPQETGRGWLFVVADGMGGAAAGRTASTMAVETVKTAYRDYVRKRPNDSTFEALSHAIEAANLAIYKRASQDESCRGMGTTIVAMAVVGDVAYTAHVGDSRIYRIRDGRLERMMRDHTRVQVLVDQGIITPSEANTHQESHVINRNLGGRADVDVDTPSDGPFKLVTGDTYLLCSDGLHGLVEDDAINELVNMAPPEHSTAALIELANRRGGYDNITVSVITAGKGPDAWAQFQPGDTERVLERLAFEDTSDTALFEAHDPDVLGPADFDTQRLMAISASGASRPTASGRIAVQDGEDKKPRGQAAHHTIMLDAPVTAAMIQQAAAQQKAREAQQKASASAPSEKKGFPWFLIIALGVVLFFLFVAAAVALFFFWPS